MTETPRRVLITGVTRGLGRAMTTEIADYGHTVIGCGRAVAAIAAIAKALGSPHDFEPVDVADDHQVAGWAERVLERHGPPDLIVNNAAVVNHPKPLWAVDAHEFQSLIDINVGGVASVVRHFVPAMIARGHGVVVNFSSGWGRSTSPNVAPYCASKWAVEGMTRALAEELPPGMAAVAVNPGVIDTEMLRTCWNERASGFPSADSWAKVAVPYILRLGPKDNGHPRTVPGA